MLEFFGAIFLLGIGVLVVLFVLTLMICGGVINAVADLLHSKFGWFNNQYKQGHGYENFNNGRYRY